MASYSNEFRERMVKRVLSGTSAVALSAEVGVSQSALSSWVRKAAARSEFDDHRDVKRSKAKAKRKVDVDPGSTRGARRPSDWTPEEKFAAVMEAAAVSDAVLGEWLRTRGLHEADLAAFREEVREAAVTGMGAKRSSSPDTKRVKELERELRRKDAALAETAALLVLRKKAVALWGEEGEDT